MNRIELMLTFGDSYGPYIRINQYSILSIKSSLIAYCSRNLTTVCDWHQFLKQLNQLCLWPGGLGGLQVHQSIWEVFWSNHRTISTRVQVPAPSCIFSLMLLPGVAAASDLWSFVLLVSDTDLH